jgi:hypothetical protein
VLVAMLCASSTCTRPNPAFGLDDGNTEPGGASSKDGSASESLDAGDLDSTTRDEGSASATTTVASDGPDETMGSTGSEVCILPQPARFNVKGEVDGVVVQPCGSQEFAGSVFATAGHQLTIARCFGGACECGEPEYVTLEFNGLHPSPAQLLTADPSQCVTVLVEWTNADEGEPCTTRSLRVRRSQAPTTTVYVAANTVDEELTTPPVTMGPALDEGCDEPCEDRPAGSYALTVDGHVLAPGAPPSEVELSIGLNDAAPYQVAALAAQIDLVCERHVSWFAYLE